METSPSPTPSPSQFPAPEPAPAKDKEWYTYISEDLPRSVQESKDSAIRSARSLQQSSSTHLRAFQEFMPQVRSQYKAYEDAFFQTVKDELMSAREHPVMVGGLVVSTGLLLMRGPRRFLFRHTLGRFQSEEAQFVRAEKNVRELSLSVDLMKKESRKLLERAGLAEKDMKHGQSDLRNAGGKIQTLAKSVYKVETEATDLMDLLREIPGRESLKLRAEVASVASHLRQHRLAMDKRILKISDLGISI